ncbi:hypothetical protein D3Z47_19345 [Lachnospiraceae bacterium]|nr:hypothetical protein [Lachnospiraceae bacterium]
MNRNNKKRKQTVSMLLTLFLLISGIFFVPATIYAAGWLDYAQDLTMGNTVSGSLKAGDYRGLTEDGGSARYWHIYRFTMPKDGLLNLYIESASSTYLMYSSSTRPDGFAIYSASNPDNIIWRSRYGEREIRREFSSSRAMYYGSTEISLSQGDYYFAIRRFNTNDTPYYLTLSYKEPVINVTSITLSPSRLTLEAGEQRNIAATVLPNNATNKTVLWKSSNPSVADVDNGTVKAVSNGTASIIATSIDGEISATCAVTVKCTHNYQASVIPATTKSNGSIEEVCAKCGEKKSQTIHQISSVNLSKTSYTYNGKLRKPAISIIDTQGSSLMNGKDYRVSYPDISAQAGIYQVKIDFIGNYYGSVNKQFKVLPKSISFTKVTSKKKGIALKWKKTAADCGYEIAYSTSKKFTKKSSHIIDVRKSRTISKTISRLKPKQRYYIRIRTYKNVTLNGKTTKLYSGWSKVKTVRTKK